MSGEVERIVAAALTQPPAGPDGRVVWLGRALDGLVRAASDPKVVEQARLQAVRGEVEAARAVLDALRDSPARGVMAAAPHAVARAEAELNAAQARLDAIEDALGV